MKVKTPNVAGAFYPSRTAELKTLLDHFLLNAKDQDEYRKPKGLIVPHAGYIYSGSVAASGYLAAKKYANDYTTVIILAPTHYVSTSMITLPTYDAFSTPIGDVSVDQEKIAKLLHLTSVKSTNETFEREHSLEVQLPFVKYLLPNVKIIPVIVGQCNPSHLAAFIRSVFNNETLIIVSGDLSHFHSYKVANEMDQKTAHNLEKLDSAHLSSDSTCGYYPILGVLEWAVSADLKIQTVELKNSGDVTGDHERVVGYGSFVIS